MTLEGLEEYIVNEIIGSHPHGCGWQYLVQWAGYGPKEDHWLTGSALSKCATLNH
jgi:hypothetical protein